MPQLVAAQRDGLVPQIFPRCNPVQTGIHQRADADGGTPRIFPRSDRYAGGGGNLAVDELEQRGLPRRCGQSGHIFLLWG